VVQFLVFASEVYHNLAVKL